MLSNFKINNYGTYTFKIINMPIKLHGKAKRNARTPEFNAWIEMRLRCNSKKHIRYRLYGARGITVCNEWQGSFLNFLNDMGERPSNKHSIDRINNDKGYYKENCRWATKAQQVRNTRCCIWIEYSGERLILADWGKKLNVDPQTIRRRMKLGEPFEFILNYYTKKYIL